MQKKDPKPEIMRLEEVAMLVKSGDIKLPKFQRPFVWRRPDMLKLLDSIYKGYPIGSILIWNSSQKLTSERSIAGLDVNVEEHSFYPTNYLLDGQQRLTTLCGALFWDGLDPASIWNIQFDLEREEFIYASDADLVSLFPLNKLINTSDFIRQCMKFQHRESGKDYVEIAERLLKSVKDYKIAVVKIGDMTIDEVAPIFERINSTGRKLTMVDLMMAATWSEDFDLTHELEGIREHCAEFGFEDLPDSIILRSLSAAAGFGVNKDDIQKLRAKSPAELLEAVSAVHKALELAISFLRTRLNVHDYSYIPYGLQLTHLVEYFRISSANDDGRLEHLTKWFWYTSASLYYSGANTGQNAKDLLRVRSFAHGKIHTLIDTEELDLDHLLFDKFNLRNASSTTFTLLLNSLNPTLTIDGRPIDGGHQKLKSNRFFASCINEDHSANQLNIGRIIYPYSDGVSDLEGVTTALEEHLLDDESVKLLKNERFSEFVLQRSAIVARFVGDLTGCNTIFSAPNGSWVDLSASDLDQEL